MSDRLERIKANRPKRYTDNWDDDDVEWLINEIERLRKVEVELEEEIKDYEKYLASWEATY